MSELKKSLREFQASIKVADEADAVIEITDALDAKNAKTLKSIMDRFKGSVGAKHLLTSMKRRSVSVNEVLKLL